MPGKAYTMRELKQIVEYLTEHRLYEDYRGRKMWMDFANSRITERTWQSLKETFLKRILPDIHNPYYKLSMEQIRSFRQCCDIEKKASNKLDIQTLSDDSDKTAGSKKNEVGAGTSKINEENPGENIKCSKIHTRNNTSTETLVLDTYEPSDACKDVASPNESDGTNPSKSIRDLITYSEPLTPLLQEVLHDFSTSDEDEPRMQIVENVEVVPDLNQVEFEDRNTAELPPADNSNCPGTGETVIPSDDKVSKDVSSEENLGETSKPTQTKIKSLKLKKTRKGTWEYKDGNNISEENMQECQKADESTKNNSKTVIDLCDSANANTATSAILLNSENTTNFSNSTIDTPLPNNQEELNNKNEAAKTEEQNNSIVKNSNTENKSKLKETNITKTTESQNEEAISELNHIAETDKSGKIKKPITSNIQDKPIELLQNHSDKKKKNNNINKDSLAEIIETQPTDVNPCLKSVSLYAETFSTSKYSDANEDDDVEMSVTKADANKDAKTAEHATSNKSSKMNNQNKNPESNSNSVHKEANEVVVLKSHTDSDSDNFEPPKKQRNKHKNISRDKALANAFGFSSGMVGRRTLHNRDKPQRFSNRRQPHSMNININIASSTSDDYTTDSESELIDRSSLHRNGQLRKYKNPQSYKTLKNPENGGLFVVGRRKIYPIVARNGSAANFACWPESDEEEESYWKLRYLEEKQRHAEEKIRADELARLLERAKERNVVATSASPILQHSTMNASKLATPPTVNNLPTESLQKPLEVKTDETVKIKFNMNNEVELECQLLHFNPVIEKLSKIFHKNVEENQKQANETKESCTDSKTSNKLEVSSVISENKLDPNNKKQLISNGDKTAEKNDNKVISDTSGVSTPVDIANVREKVDKIESAIFKEIEERDRSEQSVKEQDPNVNVTKRRRGRYKKEPVPDQTGPSEPTAKKTKGSNETKLARTTRSNISVTSDTTNVSTKRTRVSKKYSSKTAIGKPKSKSKTSANPEIEIPEDDSQVRYKFPDPPMDDTSAAATRVNVAVKKTSKGYTEKEPRIFSSPDSSRHSIESGQGYQDSDNSPQQNIKRKRRISISTLTLKGKMHNCKVKRKSCPYLADDDTYGTNILTPKKSTLNTCSDADIHISESYRLLVPKIKPLVVQFDKIDESKVKGSEGATDKYFRNISPLDNESQTNAYITIKEPQGTEGNSSNFSLPLSPELSVVENLSVSKELIENAGNFPTINEMQCNEYTEQPSYFNKYLISDVDVSAPLMGQDCAIRKTQPVKSTISETVNTGEHHSDSLQEKLRNLLLDSAKKIGQQNQQKENIQDVENMMEVDTSTFPAREQKAKAKKRCSTPRKKKEPKKLKQPLVEPVLEEHTESYAVGERQSCGQVISVIGSETPNGDTDGNNEPVKGKCRRKKNIIKVKIVRPGDKKKSNENKKSNSRTSLNIDSNIIDTESERIILNDTVEFIHNHSETCLHTHECIGDSVEFIETSANSIISVNSNSESMFEHVVRNDVVVGMTSEWLSNNVKDFVAKNDSEPSIQNTKNNSAGTDYNTPILNGSYNSLITEDLSDENRPLSRESSKWYFLSDDETNTNFMDACSQSSVKSHGANLNQIFLETCAVPNLSTITENSKENSTRKFMFDTDGDADSQSILNFNV